MEAKGEKIEGSKYVRDFCAFCKAPIRVLEANGGHRCQDCAGHQSLQMSAEQSRSVAQRTKLGHTRS